jgi:SAM-dependent methyltransferase
MLTETIEKKASFYDSINNFKERFFKSFKASGSDCPFYKWRINNGVIFSPFEIKILQKLCFYEIFKHKKVLEIGCGAGQLAIFLNLNGIRTDVVEFDKNYINSLKFIMNDFKLNFKIFNNYFQNIPFFEIEHYDCLISGDCKNIENNNLDKSLLNFRLFSSKKFIFVNGGSFADTQDSNIRMKSIFFFKDLEYRSISRLKEIKSYK